MTPFARWLPSQREPKAASAPEPTAGTMLPLGEGVPLAGEEARRVVGLIQPCFDEYVTRYDERKYPPDVYERLLRSFGAPGQVIDEDIRTAFLWKFGHLGKQRIPSRHETLISCIQERWPDLLPAIHGSTVEVFHRLDAVVGGPHWLRGDFAKNPDAMQAVNGVIRQLGSTGFFEEGEFPCPDTGRLCKGIRIVRAG